MEKEGLVRAVNHLRKRKFKIELLVTDRHKQIAKWARESLPSTKHCYDIWHLAKCMFDLLQYVIFQYPCIFPHFPSHPSPTPCHTCTHTTALRKKLDALAKEKDCELVGEWKKSVINHLYWSAVSTPNGNGELIKAKWISLDNHINNKHRGHGKLFPKCAHKAIKRAGRKKKWFKPRK